MTITTKLYTALFGQFVGSDPFGNRYFQRGRKRWVMYQGMAEPSKVPPEWHGWLHYTTDALPTAAPQPHHAWQKPAQPNLSGTQEAYLPPGHLARGAKHAPTVADYEAWEP